MRAVLDLSEEPLHDIVGANGLPEKYGIKHGLVAITDPQVNRFDASCARKEKQGRIILPWCGILSQGVAVANKTGEEILVMGGSWVAVTR